MTEKDKNKAAAKGAGKGRKTVKPGSRRPIVLVAVILCSIIMVGSILLPSLSAIVSGMQNTAKEDSATTSAATTEAATTESQSNAQLEQVDSKYQASVDKLEAKLQDNSGDAATLINLANDYFEWAKSAKSYASTDDENAHVTDLYTKAMGYYDQYLASNDANAAKVNRALCQYYTGDADGAKSALEAFVSATTDYAPAWSALGTIYEEQGDTAAATDAYNKALSADPNNEYGLQSTINSKLSSLTAATTEAATTDGSAADAATSDAATTDSSN